MPRNLYIQWQWNTSILASWREVRAQEEVSYPQRRMFSQGGGDIETTLDMEGYFAVSEKSLPRRALQFLEAARILLSMLVSSSDSRSWAI